MTQIPFSKYHATGNDFILIDRIRSPLSLSRDQIVRLCSRCYGIGADGLILLNPSSRADLEMQIFNRDGGQASMCGNGLRCSAHFLANQSTQKTSFLIEVGPTRYRCQVKETTVRVEIPPPQLIESDLPSIGNHFSLVDSGTRHLVHLHEDRQIAHNLFAKAHSLSTHPYFGPDPVNVTFATLSAPDRLTLRVYERGVGETLSCGTGAVAACYALYAKRPNISAALTVQFVSGESLMINLEQEQNQLTKMSMQGPVCSVFRGDIQIDHC